MVQQAFRFLFDKFECLAVLDTIDPLNLEFNFPTVPLFDILALAKQYNITLSDKFEITNLLVRTGRHTVLIDTGLPTASRPNAGMLMQNLQDAGISPGEIDTVIISHAHPDHIGGNFNSDLKLNYPAARFFIQQTEWDFWSSEPELKHMDPLIRQEMLDCVNKRLISLKDKLTMVKAGTDIIPGFQYVPVPGHTPGHAAVSISSGNKHLLFIADTFHSVIQLTRPDWVTPFDADSAQAVVSRKQIISRAVSDNALVLGSHFPFPAAGYIIKKGDLCFWQPYSQYGC
ncbi:MAG: MBL fold metallo-hydrolase [Dehalococcoidales bacterium]|nr:MBL fold metallo-hydrolase [Dehalococcoidales bacterium]